jgi:parallel beta-helix repeat protein
MRNILTILLLFLSLTLGATDYYVKSTGNDSNTGLSDAQAWLTIGKVNTVFSSLNAGDRIFFRRGDTFYGNLVINKSGTLANRIVIGAYGSGNKPIITGFTTVSGWTTVGGGIYSKAVTVESNPNLLVFDGVNTPMGRYPDTGWRTIQTGSSTQITGTVGELPSSPDFDGAEVVIRKNRWIIDRCTGVSHTNQTLTFTNASSYVAEAGWGYFIQNHLSTLTTTGEWYYNGTTLYVYSADAITNHTVKIATKDEIISNSTFDYIYLDNLDLQGANKRIIDIESSLGSSVYQCNLQYSGEYGIYGKYYNNGYSDSFTVDNSTISDCNESAIQLWNDFTNSTISNNTITRIAAIAGMSGSGDGKGNAVGIVFADNSLIEYNHISYCGYIPVDLEANNSTVQHNFIHHYGYVKDDVGGVYTVGTYNFVGRKILNNVIMYGLGAGDGAYNPYSAYYANGVYLDFNSEDVLVDGNTIAYVAFSGLYLHSTAHCTITNNTSFGNLYSQLYYWSDPIYPPTYISTHAMTVTNNIFLSKGLDVRVAVAESPTANIPTFWTASNNNIYTRPIDENVTMMTKISGTQSERTLASWKTYTSQDAASTVSTGNAIADTANINFIYNGTGLTKSFNLSQAMDDVYNTAYSGNISLAPYSSIILLGAGSWSEGSDPPPNYPSVTTASITSIGDVSASGGGNVTDDGGGTITARGICWNTSTDPTTANSKTTDGTGTGAFTSSITGLTASTLYYVRAYATNATGTNYGDNVTFTTTSFGRILANAGKTKFLKSGSTLIKITESTPAPPAATPLTDGLIAMWRMNENTGTNLNDSIASNDLTLSGATIGAVGKLGRAVNFTNTTDYLIKNSASLTLGTDQATIAFWFKLDALSDASLFELSNVVDWTQTAFVRVYSDGMMAGVFTNTLNASAVLFTASGVILTGTWYQCVFVNYGDGQAPKLFINGVDATSDTGLFSGSLKTIHDFIIVGNQDNASTSAPDGIIDNVVIWNRALSSDDITNLYTKENAGTGYPWN